MKVKSLSLRKTIKLTFGLPLAYLWLTLARLVEHGTTPCGTTSFPRTLCNKVAVRESARDQNFDGINSYSGSLNN